MLSHLQRLRLWYWELRTTCNSFSTRKMHEDIWTVKVVEIKPGGSKLGPLALRQSQPWAHYCNTVFYYCHIKDEAVVNDLHSKSRVCITEERGRRSEKR